MPCKCCPSVSKLNCLTLFVCFLTVFGYYVVNSAKLFGLTQPALDGDRYLTQVLSISALFNALRFIWSGALDRIPFKKVYGVLLVLQICLAFTTPLTCQNRFTYASLICLTLFCIGGHFALFPNILKQMFGKQATLLYGVLFTGTGLASLLIIGLVLSPIGQNYIALFYLFGAFSVLALVILCFIYEQRRFEPDWPLIFADSIGESQSKESLESPVKLKVITGDAKRKAYQQSQSPDTTASSSGELLKSSSPISIFS